jgi:8-oxo-dGTP pyrophosphatase MutT (NUDIX family)
MPEPDPRLHFVTATAIIARREGGAPVKFLIAKRAPTEKAFPNKWTVPGGKLVRSEYEHLPKRPYVSGTKESEAPQWYNMMEWVVRKEVMEEVNVDVKNIKYLTDLVFVRPDGYPVVTFSFWCDYAAGDAKPGKDLTEIAWVTAVEAKKYNLIEGIAEEIAEVEKIINEKTF